MDEKQLRSALRAASDCPPIEILSVRLTGAEGNEARTAAEFHLSQCLHCRTEMDLLREFETGAIRPDEAASVQWITARLRKGAQVPAAERAGRWWAPWRMPKFALGLVSFALAALLAVGISSEWRLRRSLTAPLPEFRDDTQRNRSIEIVESPDTFEWKPVAGAASYGLTVRRVDGTAIFHNSFTGTTLAFPPEVDALVKTGKLVEWEVIARDSAGREIAGSGVQRLRGTASLGQ